MKQNSIFQTGINDEVLPKLNKDITCDILIIGGGMAGLSSALKLKDIDKNVVLIDKGKVGYGVSSKTTGKLTYMQNNYTKIENIYNFKVAKSYLESQIEAIDIITKIIEKYNINCDFEKVDSYIFTNDNLNKEREFLKRANVSYYNDKLPIGLPNKDALYVRNTAVFHPLKYLLAIKNIIKDKIQIYENTLATSLDFKDGQYIIKTLENKITAKTVLVCTHYPFFVIPGFMPIKLYQNQSYVVGAKGENKKFSAINTDNQTYSVRYYQDYILLGGYSHHLSDKLDYKIEEDKLIKFYQNNFNEKILYAWQVHDNMTYDYLPLIGRLNRKNPNLLIATGFNKWGMTNGVLAGFLLGDLALNKYNKYQKLFDPARPMNLPKFLNSLVNNFKIGKTYTMVKLLKPKMKEAFITKINGVKCGIYIDDEGQKHIARNICPHLKCSLVFNSADKTWDCPCHGSRFDIDGNLLEGPSVYSIKYEN